MTEQHISAELRRLVADRGQHCCEYCRTQARYSADSLTVDHITPRSLDGLTTAENLTLCCHGCNQHKSMRMTALDPVTDARVRLFHPRAHRSEAHFAWNDDFTLMVGLTSTGRATIAALQLNRRGLVNLRRLLYAFGEHPPRPNPTNTTA
jgi:HNH endonuclease